MPITITSTNSEEVKKFSRSAWKKADLAHYGPGIKWTVKPFFLKAKENGKIIGLIRGQYISGVVQIKHLIVADDKRRLGVGRMLMQEAVKRTKRLGAHKLFLYTGKGWQACYFYEKLGFKKMADLPRHYLKRDFIIYSKQI